MIGIELTFVSMRQVINTPFRVLAIFIVAVLVVIIIINAS